MSYRDMIGYHAMLVTIGLPGTGAVRPATVEVPVTAALSIGGVWPIVRHTGIERPGLTSTLTS